MGRTANIRKKKSGGTRIADAQIRPTATVRPRGGQMMMNPKANQVKEAANLARIKKDAANQTGMFGPLNPVTKLPAKPGRGRAETNMPRKGKGNRRAVDGGGFRNKAFGMGRAGGDKMRDLAFGMGRDQRGMGMGKEQFLEGRGFKSGIEGVERDFVNLSDNKRASIAQRGERGGVENMRDILAAKQNQQRGLSKAAATARGAMVGANLGKKGTVTSRAADAIAKRGGKTNVKGGTKKLNVRSNPKVAAQMAAAFTKKMGTTQGGFRLPPKSQIKK
tara:strand:- start:847 stop:1674 length:828 start_codon:yes stop_codon:yes gene_type:complete